MSVEVLSPGGDGIVCQLLVSLVVENLSRFI